MQKKTGQAKVMSALLAILVGLTPLAIPGNNGTVAAAEAAPGQVKVVYHINDSDNAFGALRNIQNHLDVEPGVKIIVVTHGKGIDFLLKDAGTKTAIPTKFRSRISKTWVSISASAITHSKAASSVPMPSSPKPVSCHQGLPKSGGCKPGKVLFT